MRPPKTRRNQLLVKAKDSGKSWSQVAKLFEISEATACKIYKRDSSDQGRYEMSLTDDATVVRMKHR